MQKTKKCCWCGKLRTLNKFNERSDRPGQYQSYCKDCYRDYKRKWQEREYADPKRRKARLARNTRAAKARREALAAWMVEYLREHPCVDCGERDPIVLDFDHVDPTAKKAHVGGLVHALATKKRIAAEIAKCVVRCANCHRRRTAKEWGHTRWRICNED